MENIPDEILGEILQRCNSLHNAILVSKRFMISCEKSQRYANTVLKLQKACKLGDVLAIKRSPIFEDNVSFIFKQVCKYKHRDLALRLVDYVKPKDALRYLTLFEDVSLLENFNENTCLAIHLAVLSENEQLVRYLLPRTDKIFQTTFEKVCKQGNISLATTLLPYCNYRTFVIEFIHKHGIEWAKELLNCKYPNEWASRGIALGGHIHLAHLMDLRDPSKYVKYAVMGGHLEMVKFLVERGANRLENGMKEAISCGHREIIKFLQDIGVQIGTINKSHSTLMKHYHAQGNLSTEDFFLGCHSKNRMDLLKGVELSDRMKWHIYIKAGNVQKVKWKRYEPYYEILNFEQMSYEMLMAIRPDEIHCAFYNKIDLVKYVLETNIYTPDEIMDMSCNIYSLQILQYLMDKGAKAPKDSKIPRIQRWIDTLKI